MESEKQKEVQNNDSDKNNVTNNNNNEVKQNSPKVEDENKNIKVNKEEKVKVDENEEIYNALIQQWKLLKLEPQFETERQRGRYIISASLPGMKDEDFKLQINEREGSLSITGCRLPSRQDVELLKKNLLRRYKFPNEKEFTKQLFRYGINRFGCFKSSFSLPNNVISSKIEAKYEGGILHVIIPLKVQHNPQQKYPFGGAPRGYNNYFGAPNFYSPNENFF